MENWFCKKKDPNPPYTINDERRDQMEFMLSLNLKPLAEFWKEINERNERELKKNIENYKDVLSVIKDFFGENALVTKFEKLVMRFENDSMNYYKKVNKSIQEAINDEGSMYEYIKKRTNGKVNTAKEVEKFNSRHEEDEDDDENYISIFKYDIVD